MDQQSYIFLKKLADYILYWAINHRTVGPCLSRATGHGGGPVTAWCLRPCWLAPGSRRVVLGHGPGRRAMGCMPTIFEAH